MYGVVDKPGFPLKEYFIWNDDTEYTYRANKYTPILLITSAYMVHKDEHLTDDGKKVNPQALWKQYYGYRNKIHFIKNHAENNLKYLYIVYLVIESFWRSLKYFRHTLSLKNFIHVKGAIDGILNNLGKNIDPVKFNKK
jgi:GT2 family glycosyltransferase